MCQFDDAGAIGRRYRRQDEVGTPFCVTVDFDSLDDHQVTVRERDTMQQERLPIIKLVDYLQERSVTGDAAGPARTPHRGWLTLYAAAFVMMLVAGALLGIAALDFLAETGLLLVSSATSGLAIVLAIGAVVVPRRP